MIKKYTGVYCEQLLPPTIKIDKQKSRITSLDDYIDSSRLIFLTCEKHGEIARPFKTYDLSRYNRDYKSLTPCNQCDPFNYNHITFYSIKHYVESKERMKSHGCLFKLLSSKLDFESFFKNNRKKNWRNVPIKLELQFHSTEDGEGKSIESTYDKFRKNIGLNIFPSNRESWLSNLIGFLASNYETAFISEKSFEGLFGLKGGKLSYDYYFPELNLLVEIDGTQHVQETPEFHKNPGEKLKEIKHHDKLKNEYASNHGFKLIRLQAYKESKNGYQYLTPKESYEEAMNFMTDIFLELHNKKPPKISAKLTQQYFSSNGAILHRCSAKVKQAYNDEFTFIERIVPYETDQSTAFKLKCKKGHYIKISEAKATREKKYQSEKKNLCFKCQILGELLDYQKSCFKNGFRIMNINDILNSISSSCENPIDHFKKPKRSEINLLIGSTKKEHLSFYTPVDGFCIEKFTWHINRKQYNSKNGSKTGSSERSINNNAFFLLTNYDLTKIENRSEYLSGKKKAKVHNDTLRIGNKLTAPKLPKLILHQDIDYRNKSFKNIITLLKRRSDFQLVTNKNTFIDNQSYIGLKHSSCGCVSFHRAFKVKQLIDNKEPLLCQYRSCYEKQTGKNLAKSRTKREEPPQNKNSNIHEEVIKLSEGVLRPVTEPKDVRSNFQVRVHCTGSKLHNKILAISSHDNYIKRESYEKIADQIKSGIDLDSRIKIL